jgi:prostaglandin reductase 3
MALPSQYRKLVVVQTGPDIKQSTRVVQAPMPIPQANEVLIRNRFAGVNASDPVFASGGYGPQPLPFDMGIESAGEVVAVGAGVTQCKVGDAVMVFDFGGGYAEYRIAKAERIIPVPAATAEATSVLIAGLTASVALEVGELKKGETVLVTAAAGGVGSYAVQLAKAAGAHVIGTCSSDAKVQWLRQLGCDRAINYRSENVEAVLKQEYPNGLDVVIENVGRGLFDTALAQLAIFGRMVCVGAVAEYEGGMQWETVQQVRVYYQLMAKSAVIRGCFLPHYPHRFAEHLGRLFAQLASGTISAAVDPREFHGVDSIQDAIAYLHGGNNRGKVLIRF